MFIATHFAPLYSLHGSCHIFSLVQPAVFLGRVWGGGFPPRDRLVDVTESPRGNVGRLSGTLFLWLSS